MNKVSIINRHIDNILSNGFVFYCNRAKCKVLNSQLKRETLASKIKLCLTRYRFIQSMLLLDCITDFSNLLKHSNKAVE